ncbi:heterokaryon incompatibility protein-domain-containing protein [Bisporella sp. PMI_857]|nr:heterokaryon incompatibility protein-domain-containing protein [Bisporella sp. PMI_857]
MKLINTNTGLFEEFIGRDIPKYAILSHTWQEEEVSFTSMNEPSCRKKGGYRKIVMTCHMASKAGLNYAWIDTCCIDKSSSAELTEAINSMYRYYQRSNICYVFLSDLPATSSLHTELKKCRWFTRGWTLQELIAPKDIHFFDQDWNYRGSKQDLVEALSLITGINPNILMHNKRLSSVAVAQRMSWAAHRETTRIEDMAYCLLRIFEVNMPLLYGEEGRAFRRLQEEIIKSTADFSIFAWRVPPVVGSTRHNDRVFCSLLSDEPAAFATCGSIVTKLSDGRREFSVTNVGVKSKVQLLSEGLPGQHARRSILPLACCTTSHNSLGIRIRKCGPDQFIREDPCTLVEHIQDMFQHAPTEIYLLTELPGTDLTSIYSTSDITSPIAQTRSHVLHIKLSPQMELYDLWPSARFDDEDQVFFISGDSNRDSVLLKIHGQATTYFGLELTSIKFSCTFYAIGWSMIEPSSLQCTLLNYQPSGILLDEMQLNIASRDLDRHGVLSKLQDYGFPRCTSATIKIPQTRYSVRVSFSPTLVTEPAICPNAFWSVNFSWKIYETNRLPPTQRGEWVMSR